MADGQFTVDNDDYNGVLLWIKRTVNDQGVAIVDAMIVHTITFYLHEEGCGRVLDEMFIKAEVCSGADDGEHWAMVSHHIL